MSQPFHEVVDGYDDLITTIEKLDVSERYDRVHVAARALLVDGTELHVSEVWIDDDLEKYSYYWLEETGETIVGWDDAPHHDAVETFPYHKHTTDGVEPSEPMTAARILDRLQGRLE